MNKPDALIFDMDGTLWDAVDSYVWIWNEGFRQLNIPRSFTREQMLGMMGKQPDVIIKECLKGLEDINEELVYQTVFGLQEKALPHLGGTLYPGVKEGIEALSKHYKLILLSNCEHYGTGQFLKYTQLEPYFTDALSFGHTRLPKALNIQLLMSKHQLQNPIYIGDTESDQVQTHLAGLPFAFVSYGFGHSTSHEYCFDDFNTLKAYFLSKAHE